MLWPLLLIGLPALALALGVIRRRRNRPPKDWAERISDMLRVDREGPS